MFEWNDGYGFGGWLILAMGIGFVVWLVAMEIRDATKAS